MEFQAVKRGAAGDQWKLASHSFLDTWRAALYKSLMLKRTLFLAVLALSAQAVAQDAATPAAPAALTKGEILSAVTGENISLPMPSELFAALGKKGKPDWAGLLRRSPSGKFTDRPQIALNLGGLIADGYLAVEAQDTQQVKNIASDIRVLAKALGIEQEIINRGNQIIEFAENGKWDTLMEELEATQGEVILAMHEHNDKDLVTLVMLGGWLRGTEVVTGYLSGAYTPEGARVLRQPAVIDYFNKRLAAMPDKITDNPLLKSVRLTLFDIQKSVTIAADATPSEDDVKKLGALAAAAMKTISTK